MKSLKLNGSSTIHQREELTCSRLAHRILPKLTDEQEIHRQKSVRSGDGLVSGIYVHTKRKKKGEAITWTQMEMLSTKVLHYFLPFFSRDVWCLTKDGKKITVSSLVRFEV